jgi:hypothetical protein
MKKWANEMNRAFSKEEVQMAKKIHEEMLNIQRKCKLKPRYNSTSPVRMAIIKNTMTDNGKVVGKRNPHTLLVGM